MHRIESRPFGLIGEDHGRNQTGEYVVSIGADRSGWDNRDHAALVGLRADFGEALRALAAAQSGLAIVLASLAPLTLLWYATSSDYSSALRVNAVAFAIASGAGQKLLRDYYRPLIRRNPRHRAMLWTWLGLYVFVGIQMSWVLRPYIGAPDEPVQFFRDAKWENAYVVVARLFFR